MTDKNSRLQSPLNSAHDDEQRAAELAALDDQIKEAEAAQGDQVEQATTESQQRVDRLFGQTPMVDPSPGFAARVMAAIAQMPAYARRELGIGLALGLAFAAVIAVPLVVALAVALVVTLLDAGTLSSILQGAVEAAGYVVGLGRDAAGELRAWVQDSPAVAVLATALLPLVAIWAWLLWTLSGRGWRFNRPQ